MTSYLKILGIFVLSTSLFLVSCAQVGSDAWCESMQEKAKGDWSANEAADFAKHCILK